MARIYHLPPESWIKLINTRPSRCHQSGPQVRMMDDWGLPIGCSWTPLLSSHGTPFCGWDSFTSSTVHSSLRCFSLLLFFIFHLIPLFEFLRVDASSEIWWDNIMDQSQVPKVMLYKTLQILWRSKAKVVLLSSPSINGSYRSWSTLRIVILVTA